MRATLLSLLLFALVCPARAQSKLTFQLDLETLVKEQGLSPDEECRVFVRGSFNNWTGTSHELNRETGGNLYTGTFELEGQMGDTLSYKFVIEKGQGKFFWEDKPDPSNPDHGNRRLVLKWHEHLPGLSHNRKSNIYKTSECRLSTY